MMSKKESPKRSKFMPLKKRKRKEMKKTPTQLPMDGSNVWWPMEGSSVWWPMEGSNA